MLLDGKKVQYVEQGVAQSCSLSPILFINEEAEEAGLEVQLCNITGMLFADDFVRVGDSREKLQKLIDVVHS